MSIRRAIGVALLVGGVILLALGIDASGSFASEVSETFTGSPTDGATEKMIGGAVLAVFGGLLALVPGSSN